RRALDPRRVHEPQRVQLGRQLGAGRRRGGRGDRWTDGGDLPRRPQGRDRDRHHAAEQGAAARARASGALGAGLELAGAERRRPHGRRARRRGQGPPDAGAGRVLVAAHTFAAALLGLGLVAALLPRLVAYPVAALSGLTGALLLLKAVRLRRDRRREDDTTSFPLPGRGRESG